MKLRRFDEDRLGVVVGDQVHDVTEAQNQIRASARYDMKGDAVIAALPAWRKRIEDIAGQGAWDAARAGQVDLAGGAAFQDHGGAHQLRQAYRGNVGAPRYPGCGQAA